MAVSNNTKLVDTINKLLFLACDSGATPGESRAAALKALELTRSAGLLIQQHDRTRQREDTHPKKKAPDQTQAPYGTPSYEICPFKKHRGKSWAQIVDEGDVDYLYWLLDNVDFRSQRMREAVEFELGGN